MTVVQEIEAAKGLVIADLRERWQDLEHSPPNRRWGRDVLIRSIAWRLQENAFGKMHQALKLRLDRLADHLVTDPAYEPIQRPVFKPGTRLLRDWHGDTHEVTVLEKGFAWRGETFGSLSEIARKITGARWSGPRFFGLHVEEINASD